MISMDRIWLNIIIHSDLIFEWMWNALSMYYWLNIMWFMCWCTKNYHFTDIWISSIRAYLVQNTQITLSTYIIHFKRDFCYFIIWIIQLDSNVVSLYFSFLYHYYLLEKTLILSQSEIGFIMYYLCNLIHFHFTFYHNWFHLEKWRITSLHRLVAKMNQILSFLKWFTFNMIGQHYTQFANVHHNIIKCWKWNTTTSIMKNGSFLCLYEIFYRLRIIIANNFKFFLYLFLCLNSDCNRNE